MIRPLVAALILASVTAPAPADDVPADLAEGRLRGCLIAGSNSALDGDLATKVAEVRAFCGAQIRRVQANRTAGLSGEAKDAAIRTLNREIAVAVANFTGKDVHALDS